jgi:hypothetical protein
MRGIRLLGKTEYEDKIEYILQVGNNFSEKDSREILRKLESSFIKDNSFFITRFKGKNVMEIIAMEGIGFSNYGCYILQNTLFPNLKKLAIIARDLDREEMLYGGLLSNYINEKIEETFGKIES